jgi:predicted Zn-dependent protease
VSGRPEVAVISAERERDIGREEAERVIEEQGVIADAALAAYVETLGRRLAARSPRQDVTYAFRVADTAEPNAFALPGGHVFVSRGLLALLNGEDELAGVLAHEIGHVAARHAVQRVSRAAPLTIVSGLGAALAGMVSPSLGRTVGGLGRLTSEAVLAPFSRDQEREADRVGQEMVAAAGGDPAGLARMLATLAREEELARGAPRQASFLDSHPSTPERVDNTTRHARELSRAPSPAGALDRAAFLRRLDGLPVGERAADGVFEGARFRHPDLDLAVRFPDGWKTARRRGQAGAAEPAGAALVVVEAVAEGDDPLVGPRALEKATGTRVVQATRRETINGLGAARTRLRARTESGEVALELAWVAHAGHVVQVAGVTPLRRAQGTLPAIGAVIESVRPLSPAERAGFREVRLRIVEAKEGETVEALARRSRSTWSPAMVAVANGLSGAGDRLSRGRPVKVAVSETYTPRRPR